MSQDTNPQPSPALVQCKCCCESVNPTHQLCPVCNFPLKGTEEEQNNFIYQRGYKQMELNELKGKSARAAITFYILAGVLLLWGVVGFFKADAGDIRIYIIGIYGFLAVAFLLLGVWSDKKPIPAIICGLVLYVALSILNFVADPGTITSGIIIKALIIVGLVRALVSALDAEKIRKEHKI